MLKTALIFTTLGLASLALPVAAADTYKVDPQHAWVGFTTSHAGWSNAMGVFSNINGTIVFDHDDVSKSSVEVTVDASTISSGFKDRDHDMNSPDFFNTAEFPTVTFKSTKIEKTGDKTANISGDLTIIGVTKPVVLAANFINDGPLPWDPTTTKAGFAATTSVKPADFGMSKFTDYGLGPDVALTISLEAFKQK